MFKLINVACVCVSVRSKATAAQPTERNHALPAHTFLAFSFSSHRKSTDLDTQLLMPGAFIISGKRNMSSLETFTELDHEPELDPLMMVNNSVTIGETLCIEVINGSALSIHHPNSHLPPRLKRSLIIEFISTCSIKSSPASLLRVKKGTCILNEKAATMARHSSNKPNNLFPLPLSNISHHR